MLKNIAVLSLALFLIACSGSKTTPEQEIEQFIEAGIEAAENRERGKLEDMIAEDYLDAKGLTRKQLSQLMRAYFFRHKNIHLFTKMQEISFPVAGEAVARFHVAMAGQVISDVTALSSLRAQVYEFELQLVKDDEWKLKSAAWQVANLSALQ